MNANPIISRYYDLSGLSIAEVSGDDAPAFLQGQLSNDITHLDEDSSHQLSAYCNPKGRMLALFHVLQFNGAYLLIAPHAVMDKVLPRLSMFVMRSAVEIKPVEGLSLLGLHAPGITDEELITIVGAGMHRAKLQNDPERYFLLTAEKINEPLETYNEWNRLDIEQNLPQIYIESYEALIPQSVNLEIIGGVNFKKGCFPGQEIIARVKYRGKPKTRMIGVKLSGSEPVEVGASIYVDQRDRSAGEVINVADGAEDTLLSISVPATHISQGALYLDEGKTIKLERIISPYEITL
jgi:folate-binding protein YgfZ